MSVPKAELHVHVEGAASPDLVRRIAARNKLRVPDGVIGDDGKFLWKDFLDFLNTYDAATSVIRTGEDYRDIVFEYLVECAAEGAIYVELTASADHAADVGLSDEEHLAALAQGIDDARDATGIEGRIVMSCVRHFGPDKAREVARRTVEGPHPTSPASAWAATRPASRPRTSPMPSPSPARPASASPFMPASGRGRRASAAGSRWGSAGSATACARARIPSWYVSLLTRARCSRYARPPTWCSGCIRATSRTRCPRCAKPGSRVTLGSDDPPYWDASIGGEYAVAAERMGFDEEALREVTKTALRAAFVQDESGVRLLDLV